MIRKALELDVQQRRGAAALGVDGDRDNAAYIDSLGWVLFRRGRLKEARRSWRKRRRCPTAPTIRWSGITSATSAFA